MWIPGAGDMQSRTAAIPSVAMVRMSDRPSVRALPNTRPDRAIQASTFRLLYFVGHFYAVMRNGNGNGIRRYIALGVMCTCAYRGGFADIIARYSGQAKQRFNGT